jgi:hypothetical protein
MPFDFIHSLFQQATASGSRSTVLADLRWFISIVAGILLATLSLKAPDWIIVLLVGLLVLGCLLYVGAYIYFARRAPDYLRSEMAQFWGKPG